MSWDLSATECRALDLLEHGSQPTRLVPARPLASLTAAGYIETTWADRVRLTATGRELFQVASA